MTEKTSFITEFIAFIKGFGVVGLAVGLVIGQAVTTLVTSVVTNLLTPLLQILTPEGVNFAEWMPGGFGVGPFINDLISFLFILLVIYIVVKFAVARIMTEAEKEAVGIK